MQSDQHTLKNKLFPKQMNLHYLVLHIGAHFYVTDGYERYCNNPTYFDQYKLTLDYQHKLM